MLTQTRYTNPYLLVDGVAIDAVDRKTHPSTGSTAVGKQLERLAADGMKRTTMELGGHAPDNVFGDTDVERAASMCAQQKVRNVGQICVSPTRFFVHEHHYETFVARMGEIFAGLTVGDGFDPRSQVGPFFEPTVLADVPPEADIMNEEPFGPVAVIASFASFDAVVGAANRLPYGLAGYAFTDSLATATAVSDALEVGMVGINGFGITFAETPFGGVKESGHGSEGGSEGLSDYMITKAIVQS